MSLGAAYEQQNQITSAIQHYEETLSLNPDQPIAYFRLGEGQYEDFLNMISQS